jgi:hypothetical protein
MEMGKAPYCRVVATDAPTYGIILFMPARSDTVRYYMGCAGTTGGDDRTARPFLQRLSAVADSVDAISGAKDWIKPDKCWLPGPCK